MPKDKEEPRGDMGYGTISLHDLPVPAGTPKDGTCTYVYASTGWTVAAQVALANTQVTAPADHDLLTWVAADGKWENVKDITVRNLTVGEGGVGTLISTDDFFHSGDQLGVFGHAVANQNAVTDSSGGTAATVTPGAAGAQDTVTVGVVDTLPHAANAIATIIALMKRNGIWA